jgi:hypothetical protein
MQQHHGTKAVQASSMMQRHTTTDERTENRIAASMQQLSGINTADASSVMR